MTLIWQGNNFAGTTKRAVVVALVISFGSLGGIVRVSGFEDQARSR